MLKMMDYPFMVVPLTVVENRSNIANADPIKYAVEEMGFVLFNLIS
jgi:hypothetical protein